jgi:hypothetical protein
VFSNKSIEQICTIQNCILFSYVLTQYDDIYMIDTTCTRPKRRAAQHTCITDEQMRDKSTISHNTDRDDSGKYIPTTTNFGGQTRTFDECVCSTHTLPSNFLQTVCVFVLEIG